MNFDTSKYVEALRDASGGSGCVGIAGAHVCILLALGDQAQHYESIIRQHCEKIAMLTREINALQLDAEAECTDLGARIAVLQGQLEAANSRPLTLVVSNGVDAVSLPSTNGNAMAHAAATNGIDWTDLPDEYRGYIDQLADGSLKWSGLPNPAKRSIALYVIDDLAVDGGLTLAYFEKYKPEFMPTGGAISQMFGIRWIEVVENAVKHAA